LSTEIASSDLLLPRPRHVRLASGTYRLRGRVHVIEIPPHGRHDDIIAAATYLRKSTEHRIDVVAPTTGSVKSATSATSARIAFEYAADARDDQWYALHIRPHRIVIRAGAAAGFRYGVTTLGQLLNSGRPAVQAMDIEDWPDFPARGVMLDVSRDKMPTLRTLKHLIDLFATWKINQLQLYTEHTFAYAGHERVWRGASPLTSAQVEELDAYCQQRSLELVPNQNSFGHMERWLRHEPYARLAEMHGSWKTPWGEVRDMPGTLNPLHPGSIRLIASLYEELLPHFSSRLFNVGCDETWELGQGASQPACRRRGVGRVYLDFLLKVHRQVERHHRRMMFWADILLQHPELIRRLPRDVIPLVWGYEADHPFDRQCGDLAASGLQFYVCPGTSSWNSFGGRTSNCLANLRQAARSGRRHGAAGYLITDWGDFGHRQYLPVSYCGFLYGAALAWCEKTNTGLDVAQEVSRHIFDDESGRAGQLWHDVGTIHEETGVSLKNRTVLFRVMQAMLGDSSSVAGLTAKRLASIRSRLEELTDRARAASFGGPDGSLVRAELLATLAVLGHACERALLMLGWNDEQARRRRCRWLARDMSRIIKRHRSLWLARNRPGGLASSLSYYRRNLQEYLGIVEQRTRRASH
jgi:hypothetical protein